MINSPIVTFFNYTELGIDTVPTGSLVHIQLQNNVIYELINITGLSSTSTVQNAIDNGNLKKVTADPYDNSEYFTATALQDTFVSTLDLTNGVKIFLQGILQNQTSYTITGQNIVFTSKLDANTEIYITL